MEAALARSTSVRATLLDSSGASLSQGAVCPGTRPGFGDSQTDPGYQPGACNRTTTLWAIKLLLGPGWALSRLSLRPFCPLVVLPLPLFTHTVHRPVMENADKLTGRRIQAVMREGSQGGGGVGRVARGRWVRGDGPGYLKIPGQNHQLRGPGGKREVKVQGPVNGQNWCRGRERGKGG